GMEQTMSRAIPGQTFTVTARLYNRGKTPVKLVDVGFDAPQGWTTSRISKGKIDDSPINPGEARAEQFQITVPADAKYTEPYFSRRDPEAETVYTISDPKPVTNPWPPYPLHVTFLFSAQDHVNWISSVAKIKFVDPTLGQYERPLAVGPPISVLLNTPVLVAPVGDHAHSELEVSVRGNTEKPVHATLHLETPQGWKVEPESLPVD